MADVDLHQRPDDQPGTLPGLAIGLPVLGTPAGHARQSTMSRWRMMSLVAVHLLILGHVAHWLITGSTLSPIEPSEAMYTLRDGYVNAGFLFFAAALASTVIFGRFVLKLRPADAWGSVCGGMTSSAALAAVKRASDSNEPAVSYAAAFALASVLVTVSGQVVVRLMG